ncbi:HET-domain-containing protein [Hyaloscypha hepaticicola]|uniref:HET-domain-containing protein n=1 Tax=Hyaloscypha hepaticicola TaxID=2082293 RepID=A0A2J6PKH8_9HELO|nr:HET-domain-containing protein [Hyaloscypha hepaticicola]
MPSRIIEISWMRGSQEPPWRLLQNPPWENYVALSYCWGGDQPMKTTLSTIQQFSSVLPFSELPKSLRDAVLTTFSLSLRLLWVDSLCIIQDNSVETAKEIASMPQIYQNAHVTISAARSARCQNGFLHEISMPSAQAQVFKLPFSCPDGNFGSVNLLHDPDLWDPIERRAWPLQEFLLSRRILKYGSDQLSCSCLSIELHGDHNAEVDWFSKRDQRLLDLRWRYRYSQYNTNSIIDSWRHLVSEYTRHKLTESKDKLLAILGLATDIGTRRDDKYLGGLWLRDLPVELLWEVTSPLKPRPREYRAPSWSWASVDGIVECFVDADAEVDPDIRVLSYGVKPAESTAPYGGNGALESGYIQTLGRMRRADWIEDRKTLVVIETGDATVGYALARTTYDADYGVSIGPISVWCLQICPYEPTLEKGPDGLILTTEDEKFFRRISTFSYDPDRYEDEDPSFYDIYREHQQKWADGCQLRTIIII